MDDQKAFVRLYRRKVAETSDHILDVIRNTASREEFEPELFLEDVIHKVNALFKKEG